MTAGRVALALYAAFLLGIAVWRPWATPAAPFSGRWELAPFTGTANLWRAGIVPFGFGLPALTPLRRAVVPLCFLGSLLIEALQWAFGTGVPQVEDILLNTLGAALGYALFRAANPHPATNAPATPRHSRGVRGRREGARPVNPLARERRSRDTRPQPAWRPPATNH